MRKLFILSAFVLATVALPLQISVASDAAAQTDVGAWMEHGQKAEVATITTAEGSLATDTTHDLRFSLILPVARTFETDEYQGLGLMVQLQKYFPLGKSFKPYVLGAIGVSTETQEDEHTIGNNFKAEFGIHLYKFIALGASGYWMPRGGDDVVFTGLSVKLLKPIQ